INIVFFNIIKSHNKILYFCQQRHITISIDFSCQSGSVSVISGTYFERAKYYINEAPIAGASLYHKR
ncbi:hypothetical protein, partial [Escherichia coli]|uniref:hypothetical protein n=1 Tax=Escherichia coli TaxID=562 RepID=UPI001BFC1426